MGHWVDPNVGHVTQMELGGTPNQRQLYLLCVCVYVSLLYCELYNVIVPESLHQFTHITAR